MTVLTLDRRLAAVGRSLDPGEVERRVLAAVREIVGTDRNLVLLRDEDRGFSSSAWDGFATSPPEGGPAAWATHPAVTAALTAPGPILLEPANGAGAGRASPLMEVQAGLVAPLRGDGGVVGVLVAGSARPRTFTPEDREGLEALADHAGLALDHARRHAEVTARSHRLVALARATHRLSGHRPWSELLVVIAEEARQLLGASAAACRVLEGDELAAAIPAGDANLAPGGLRLKVGEGLCGLVAARGAAIRLTDVSDPSRPDAIDADDLARRGVRACLAVPLLARDQVVGVLAVYATERGRFDEDDEALLTGFAGHAAAAVENSRLVQQLLHAERLAAVGRIVAGVAHELNNPLAVVIGTADLLRREVHDSRVDERLRRIGGQAQRAVKIVRSLLALARKQPTTWTTVDLNSLIEETLELEGYQFRSGRVTVVRDLAPGLPRLLADANQLQQVFTNLFLNALEAMRESRGQGTLTVSTRPTGADRVTVTVADDGPGIAPGDVERVFEPFFTTKKELKGTGLGLSICRQIVENHRGQIRAESRPGAGTTFSVELPISREEADRATEPARVDGRPRPSVPVLLVEDERVVGDLLAEFLSLEGHQVDRAANGREALELVRQRDYALIVSDVRMPDLDGPALYRELGTVNPLLTRRMLFVTGDVMSPETRRFLDETRLAYLEKPFGIGEFQAAVRSVLDRPACSERPAKSA